METKKKEQNTKAEAETFAATVKGMNRDDQLMLPDTALTGEGIDASYGGDGFWFNNGAAERCPCRGAYWRNGGDAGVFSVYLGSPRSYSLSNFGGRSAYQE